MDRRRRACRIISEDAGVEGWGGGGGGGGREGAGRSVRGEGVRVPRLRGRSSS